jgi:hypothetical protein
VTRIFGGEGRGPALGKLNAVHCAGCAHIQKNFWLQAGVSGAALAMAMAGAIIAVSAPPVGIPLGAVGVALAAYTYWHLRRPSARERDQLPEPLHPKVAEISLSERIRTRINLGPMGEYQTELEQMSGKLEMVLTLSRADRDRVVQRRRKRSLSPDENLTFTAGRLVLRGQIGIGESGEVPGAVIELDGDTADHSVFRAEHPPASSRWSIRRQYDLPSDPQTWSAPFWITPSIVPESNKHALELDIQWVEIGPEEGSPLTLDVIRLLRLRFPLTWGSVQQVSQPGAQRSGPGNEVEDSSAQQIEWRQLSPSENERRDRRLRIALQFEHRITAADEISGDLEVIMKGTLSGVEGVQLYSALGTRRRYSGAAKIQTHIESAFTLSLASVRYQAVRVVPDPADEDRDHSGFAAEFNVIPDGETVIALTNAMSSEGYYVKRVVENPPRSGGRANYVQRYWDIAGRIYSGIYPVDFHLILVGQEVHGEQILPDEGTTKVRIVVSGAYTDNHQDRYDNVENVWRHLRALTEEALHGRISTGQHASALGEDA